MGFFDVVKDIAGVVGNIGSAAQGVGSVMQLVNGDGGLPSPWAQMQANVDWQREFAQNGVRWRVEDAKAAGLHPLFALGMQGASFTPSAIVGRDDVGSRFAEHGQDLSRAMHAMTTTNERASNVITQLAITRAELENDLLRARIAQLNSPGTGPGLPGYEVGRAAVSPVTVEPLELNATDPGRPSKEAGYVSDFTFVDTGTGLQPVSSKDMKDRIEDNLIPEIMQAFRNNFLPNFPGQFRDRVRPDPYIHDSYNGRPVYGWNWDYMTQQFVPVYDRGNWRSMD